MEISRQVKRRKERRELKEITRRLKTVLVKDPQGNTWVAEDYFRQLVEVLPTINNTDTGKELDHYRNLGRILLKSIDKKEPHKVRGHLVDTYINQVNKLYQDVKATQESGA